MKTRTIITIIAAAIAATAPAQEGALRLPSDAKAALVEALAGPDGEYAARATYDAILKKFGDVQPYKSIIQAENRHIQALERQLRRYGIAIPKDKFAGKIEAPKTLKEAARQGVEAEIDNVKMFDKLLPKIREYSSLTRVFTNLRRASKEAHLPAFQRALKNEGGLTRVQFADLVEKDRERLGEKSADRAWPNEK
jgi:hypothetical protein